MFSDTNRKSISAFLVVMLSLFCFQLLSSQALATSEEEKTFLSMYFKEEELVIISTTRSLKSITRVAENVEVVTKEDMELMNAHTLADVLNTVNGVAVAIAGASPGSIAPVSIQGSAIEHVVVFVDGIAVNFLSSDVADASAIPVQMIEKVEVIKGPASSVWGSSLGGVVNVITKSPRSSTGPGGALSASYGERNTADLRAEVLGTRNGFGYYLFAGRLQTDGLRPLEEISSNGLYTKFTYDIANRTSASFSLFHIKGDREEGDLSAFDLLPRDRFQTLLATATLHSALSDEVALNLSLRAARIRFDSAIKTPSTGGEDTLRFDDRKYGASAKVNWEAGFHNIVAGSDYDYKKALSDVGVGADLNVFAVYVNDTITLGKLSVTPGIRHDHTDRHDDFTSPSLGMAYQLAEKTLLRAYIARGFNLPNLGATVVDGEFYRHNADLRVEKVWSFQAGLESGLLKYLWLKMSAFRHDIRNAIVREDLDIAAGTWTAVNKEKVRRQGFEAEIRSMKFHNLTLSAAAAFVGVKDLTTGEEIHDLPDYTYDVSLKYDDEESFRALLKGRYIWWRQTREGFVGKYTAFLFDVNLIKTVIKKHNSALEVFLTGHNIFNGAQYSDDFFKNARRWVESGARYKF